MFSSIVNGHVKNGVVVLDNNEPLMEGMKVQVVLMQPNVDESERFPLRGAEPFSFEDPFSPALPDSDWDALK